MQIKVTHNMKMTIGGQNQHQQFTNPINTGSMAENNEGGDPMVQTVPETVTTNHIEEEPASIIKQYHGREWSEIAHILQIPPDSEKDDEEEGQYDCMGSSALSEVSSDSHDDPLAEDIHDIVNVVDNMIRSQSNLNCDATSLVEFLDLDLFKYETMLAEVEGWDWDSEEFFNDDSLPPADSDTVNT